MNSGIIDRSADSRVLLAHAAGDLQVTEPIITADNHRSVVQSQVAHRLVGATSALGLSVFIERGAGFLANILAARLGGTATFGAYSLAITSANQISTYAAGGIGATAARFSGKYPFEGQNYGMLAKVLAVVSLVSAAVAAMGLYFGAAPIAHLLGKQELTSLLRWASLAAAGMIVLECARGFFVGQRRLRALVLLSLLVGVSMVLFLPAAARAHRPEKMIVLQGAITCFAVAACLLMSHPLQLRPRGTTVGSIRFTEMLREVWAFGLVQLAGLIGANLAGWWLTTLVARSDTSLVQMSFFAIASQLRNLVGIAPSLLTEGSYAVMADPLGEQSRTPHRVMAFGSYIALCISFLLASIGILVLPWAISLLYGGAYAPAAITIAVGLATAVVHMGNAPAAARLTIVSIRSTGVINTVWAVFVAAAATLFLMFKGSAWQAMSIYFAAHILSSTLVLISLNQKDGLPDGMPALFAVSATCSIALAALAYIRAAHPQMALGSNVAMASTCLVGYCGLGLIGRHYRWLPPAEIVRVLIRQSLRRRYV